MFSRPSTPTSGPRRAASVVLGLLLALAAVLGCATHPAEADAEAGRQPVAVTSTPQGPSKEQVCAVPGHHQCHGTGGAVARTTPPTPHPAPQSLPTRVDARPATTPLSVRADPAAPRPPDLHVLQVSRT